MCINPQELIRKLIAHEASARKIGSTCEADAFAARIAELLAKFPGSAKQEPPKPAEPPKQTEQKKKNQFFEQDFAGGMSLTEPAIDYVRRKGWINDWEANFYENIRQNSFLTEKQAAKKDQIDTKVKMRIDQEWRARTQAAA